MNNIYGKVIAVVKAFIAAGLCSIGITVVEVVNHLNLQSAVCILIASFIILFSLLYHAYKYTGDVKRV